MARCLHDAMAFNSMGMGNESSFISSRDLRELPLRSQVWPLARWPSILLIYPVAFLYYYSLS